MNEKTIGGFLSALRKANGYTQQQVADVLCVSNKTVSKWERGDGYPEITMLPAIAELYNVTVDEILKGERIIKTSSEKEMEKKVDERIKLITEKSSLKFKNHAIVAFSLGLIGVVFAPFICDNLYKDVYVVALIVVLLMEIASVIVALVACNNHLSTLKSNITENINNIDNKNKVNVLLSVESVFAVTAIVTGISGFSSGANVFAIWFFALIATVSIAIITCFILNSEAESKTNPKIQKLRKKILKTTGIIVAIIVVLNALTPFSFCIIDSLSPLQYCFTDAVGYGYETKEEAINDYYNLKAYFAEGKELYYVFEYSTEKGDCYAYADKFDLQFEGTEKGYRIDVYYEIEDFFEFKSPEETEEFLKTKTISDNLAHILKVGYKITFEDETYTVSCVPATLYKMFEHITDIAPVFVIIALVSSFCAVVIDVIIYNVKKKKLK